MTNEKEYKLTKKHRKKISKARQKYFKNHPEVRKELSEARRIFTGDQEQQICDEYFSEEKPSIIVLGKKWGCNAEVVRRIILEKGCKLRSYKEAAQTESTKKRQREAQKGEKGSFYGKHHSEETKKKMSERRKKGLVWNRGNHLSEEHKKKISEKMKGKNHPNYGRRFSEEVRSKFSRAALLRTQNRLGPWKDTKPELEMKRILERLNIPFEHQFRIKGINHIFDFHILNTNILIEADGDYWHGNSKMFKKLNRIQKESKQRDKKINKLAKANNFILLRFWENNILNNKEIVKKEILKFV